MPLTLPVLDAFFSDDAFAGELKQKLHLTDDQVSRLRKVARQETATLREPAGDQGSNESTDEARKRAAEKISAIISEQKTQELASLIRERWSDGAKVEINTAANALPTDTRIVVNAPAYRMDLYDKGQLIKTYRVAIGYPEFPLPTGLRLARSIIFNPTWTPPDEPWVERSNKVKVGEKIEAGDKNNPLGPIKIPIGLPSLIHGGKPIAKIGALGSHGCVGLTSPQVNDFAQLLAQVSNTDLSETQITDYEKNPKATRKINLNTPVPVELRYETLVVEDGKLHIYRDVYDRNTNTEDNLRNVLKVYGVTEDQLSPDERAKIMDGLREMSRDANGKLDDQSSKPLMPSDRKSNPTGKVTYGFKGKKEVVVDVAALSQKGYPAPVNLSTGVENKRQTTASARKTRKR
jgi:lipoprotein-anchoring transpeptidase ErfK/SrfK